MLHKHQKTCRYILTSVLLFAIAMMTATPTMAVAVTNVRYSDPEQGNLTGYDQVISDASPAIDLEKYVWADDYNDADVPPGPEMVEGEQLTFWFFVVNTGNVELTDIHVTDDVIGGICGIASLAAGDHIRCEAYGFTVERGQHTNVGTVTARFGSTTVTDSDPANYYGVPIIPNPGIAIHKRINGIDADTAAEGPVLPVGSTAIFTYAVINTGNVPLSNVLVVDNKLGTICTITILYIGQSRTCYKNARVTSGLYSNLAKAGTWFGDPKNGGIKVEDTDRGYYTGQ